MRIRGEARISKLKQVHTYVPCEEKIPETAIENQPTPRLQLFGVKGGVARHGTFGMWRLGHNKKPPSPRS